MTDARIVADGENAEHYHVPAADDEALSLAKMKVLEKRHPWTNRA